MTVAKSLPLLEQPESGLDWLLTCRDRLERSHISQILQPRGGTSILQQRGETDDRNLLADHFDRETATA